LQRGEGEVVALQDLASSEELVGRERLEDFDDPGCCGCGACSALGIEGISSTVKVR